MTRVVVSWSLLICRIKQGVWFLQFPWIRSLDTARDRNSHQKCSIKKVLLINFEIFAIKRLCWSLFLEPVFTRKCLCWSLFWTLFRMGEGQKASLPVLLLQLLQTWESVPQICLTYSFNPFVTMV